MDLPSKHLKELEKYIDQKLDGILTFLLRNEELISIIIMDIVPLMQSIHHDYRPRRHSEIILIMKRNASPKEITITILQQLEYRPCYYSLPLLLPLLTIPNNKSYNDILVNLQNTLEAGYFCSDCLHQQPSFVLSKHHYAVLINILVEFDSDIFTSDDFLVMHRIIDHIISENISLFMANPLLEREFHLLMNKYELSFVNLMNNGCYKNDDLIPRAYIVSHGFNNMLYLPSVYQASFLFSQILPWVSAILELCHSEFGEPQCSTSLTLGLKCLSYMIKQAFTITNKHHVYLLRIVKCLISNAVNNKDVNVRKCAATILIGILEKASPKEKLSLVKEFYNHQNGSVSAIFIDSCKSIFNLATRIDGQIKSVLNSVLNLEIADIMIECDRVLATLSLIQSFKQNRLSFCTAESVKYISKVSTCVAQTYTELQKELRLLESEAQSEEADIPATLNIDGEVLTEPSASEQVESIKLAQCRLDLISYNLARCRENWDK